MFLSLEIKMTSLLVASVLALFVMSVSATPPAAAALVTATAPRLATKRYKWELDTATMLSKSTFKIKPAQLIERCKEVIDKNIGLENNDDLAEDFIFQFPVIGPLSKKEYLEAVKSFKITDTFPDLDAGFCDFRVDPFRPNRVWFTSNFLATHTGEGSIFGKPTGKRVECPPQSLSLSFNEAGQVVFYTGGYVMDKTIGNTGGMGGLFGPLYCIGKPFPFPEAYPWSPSWQFRAFQTVGKIAGKIAKMTGKK